MLALVLREEKKIFFTALSKSAGLIKEFVDKSLHPLLSKKSAAEMWIILEKRFQHISLMSMTRIFLDVYAVKLSDCNNVIDYTSRYQIAFDKLLSLLNTESWMSKKTIKMTLQGNLLRHLGRDYTALVSAIDTNWKEETTNLADTILRVIRYADINKGNDKDNADVKVLAANIHRAPRKPAQQKSVSLEELQPTTPIDARSYIQNSVLNTPYAKCDREDRIET